MQTSVSLQIQERQCNNPRLHKTLLCCTALQEQIQTHPEWFTGTVCNTLKLPPTKSTHKGRDIIIMKQRQIAILTAESYHCSEKPNARSTNSLVLQDSVHKTTKSLSGSWERERPQSAHYHPRPAASPRAAKKGRDWKANEREWPAATELARILPH